METRYPAYSSFYLGGAIIIVFLFSAFKLISATTGGAIILPMAIMIFIDCSIIGPRWTRKMKKLENRP
jgi:hypothetical protein